MTDFDKLSKQLHRIADERDKLFEENKALKETLDLTTDLVVDYQERLVKFEKNRDELLEAVSQSEIVKDSPVLNPSKEQIAVAPVF